VPCLIMKVFKRRDKPKEPLLVVMTTTRLAPLDQVRPDQTHMGVETLALIHMEAEILVRVDMEETAEATTTTTTRCLVLV